MKASTLAARLKIIAASALAMLLAAPMRAELSVVAGAGPDPAAEGLAEAIAATGSVGPAYRFVEGLSDGLFDFTRRHILGALLPGRLTRDLKVAPRQESAPLFDRNLHKNESRYLARVRAAYPIIGDGARPASQAQLQAWRGWAAAEQASVAVDSLKDTLIERYQFELFGESYLRYAKDRRNWDTGFLATTGILGGAFLYLNGMHASSRLGGVKLGIDLAPGLKLRRALQGDGNLRNLAGLELGYKDKPLTLATEWGLSGGRVKNERIALNYRLRY